MNKKYNIENNINFYDELYKSFDDDSSEELKDNNDYCLITYEKLTDKFVELNCGHKFNYIPLYNDLVNHLTKFNNMETIETRLKTGELRCPYCRKTQLGILPYYEELGLNKINGVNYLNYNKMPNIYKYNKCQYVCQNPEYDDSKPSTYTNQQMLCCSSLYGTQIKIYNNLNPSTIKNFGDENYYCWEHKKQMIKKYKLEEKQKEKEAAKIEKQKEKEASKLKKQIEKTKIKSNENVVLGLINVVNYDNETDNNQTYNGCIEILKSGIKKGNKCGCKIYMENVCKRHYNLIDKKVTKTINNIISKI
jgi:hypothetical protein